MYRSRGRVLGEATVTASLAFVLMVVGAAGLGTLFAPMHVGWRGWDPVAAGLAVVLDPIAGAGGTFGFWVAAIVIVGMLTRRSTVSFRIGLYVGVTVVVTVVMLLISSVAAFFPGDVGVHSVAMTLVSTLLFLLAAVISLLVVPLWIFRDDCRPATLRRAHRGVQRASYSRAA